MALLLTLGQAPALAATLTVSGPAQTQNVITLYTLVDAITAANSDTATGGCQAGSGADTIVLPAGSTQTLTAVNNTTLGVTGLPLIESSITLQGNNSTITRAGEAPDFRIIAVNGSGNLTLQQTTVSGGRAVGSFPFYNGGGIINLDGIVTLIDSTVSGNSSSFGGGVYNRGTMTLTGSTISGNSAYNGGGMASRGPLALTDSTILSNSAFFYGGGVVNGGPLTLTDSTVSGNFAGGSGGGMYNNGTLTLINSTVSGNSAGRSGGGMENSSDLALTNSTVSGNTAGIGGGGVYNRGTLTLTDSTVSGNSARYGGGVYNRVTLTLNRSLISGNTNLFGTSEVFNYIDGFGSDGIINADNFNLFGHSGNAGIDGFIPGPRDIVPGVPLGSILAPLADNGGKTHRFALPCTAEPLA